MRNHGYNGDYQVTVVRNVNKIEDGAFYIKKADGTYHKPYVGDSSFIEGRSSSNEKRVLWFGKDYGRVPTMNRGEKIVYRSSSEFDPKFRIERFQDIGYTIGICNMMPTTTGRYFFSTALKDNCIDLNSSAGKLYSLGSHNVTMEVIGDAQLRSGNISQAGTIIGLERGKTYDVDIYIGTEVMKYEFVADVRALNSMEVTEIKDFEYESNKVISFEFPDYFHSGYYLINGFGVVRYVDSDEEYDESMAMNIPNSSGSEEEQEEEDMYQQLTATTETVPFVVDEQGSITVSVRFDTGDGNTYAGKEKGAGDSLIPPTGRVLGESGSYTLNLNDAQDTLSGTFELEPGRYTIEIRGLAGRSYSYIVRKAEEKQ